VVQVVAAAGLAVLLVGAGCDPPGQEQGDHGGSGQQGHLQHGGGGEGVAVAGGVGELAEEHLADHRDAERA